MKPNLDLIKNQYSEYYQMLRWHITASWNIPSLTLVVITASLSLSIEKFDKLKEKASLSAFLFLTFFILSTIMYIHHRRNLLWVTYFEKAIREIEEKYGEIMTVHHSMIQTKLTGIDKISSSKLLGWFLLFISFVSLISAIIMFFKIGF